MNGRTGLGNRGWKIQPRSLLMSILREFLCVVDQRSACLLFSLHPFCYHASTAWRLVSEKPYPLSSSLLCITLHSAAYHSQIERSHNPSLHAVHHLPNYPPPSSTAGTSSPNNLTAFSAITSLMPSSSPLKTSRIASTLVLTLGHSPSSSSAPKGGKKG